MDMNLIHFPEDAGLSSRGLLRYLDAVERSGLEHHTILVARHGKVAARMCFAPYGKDDPHMLFSLSKLFTSAAAGFARRVSWRGTRSSLTFWPKTCRRTPTRASARSPSTTC